MNQKAKFEIRILHNLYTIIAQIIEFKIMKKYFNGTNVLDTI